MPRSSVACAAASRLGSPVCMTITNRVWKDWQDRMSVGPGDLGEEVTRLRPGHADLAGVLKYGHSDVRNILERASARETAARVAVGGLAALLLEQFGIVVRCHTVQIGTVVAQPLPDRLSHRQAGHHAVARSGRRCGTPWKPRRYAAPTPLPPSAWCRSSTRPKSAGTTWGGVAQVIAYNVPVGLGSHIQWDRRLDGLLAQALMSIPSVKGVDIGDGFASAALPGNEVHDVIRYDDAEGWVRPTNRAGGLEGGITNGEPLTVQVAFKPISTMRHALPSADLRTGEEVAAHYERSDTSVVPAGGVVAEAMVRWVLAAALVEKCGGDSLEEMQRNFTAFQAEQRARVQRPAAAEQVRTGVSEREQWLSGFSVAFSPRACCTWASIMAR